MRPDLNIISFLWLSIMLVSAVATFPEIFLVGEEGQNLQLSCPTAKLPVIWKQDNMEIENTSVAKVEGSTLTLDDFEEDQTGNYTCWSDGELVHYTYILLNKSREFTGLGITCTAETFNCTFNISCNMKQDDFQDFRLRNERDNSSWVQPSKDGVFYLTHSTNPYAEEAQRLVVTGEAVSSSGYYFKTSHSFYLRDIIKPGCPEFSIIQRRLFLMPPPTWAQPLSYYPLEHEVECQRRDNGEEKLCQLGTDNLVPSGISKLRVRCRDSLLLSQWSDWTPWQNVGKRKNGKKRNTKDGKKKDPHRRRNKNSHSPH